MIIKGILDKSAMKVWTGFNWLRLGFKWVHSGNKNGKNNCLVCLQ
jgi:hypothetical protein